MEIADAVVVLAIAGMGGWGAMRLTRLYYEYRHGKWERHTKHSDRQVVVYVARVGHADILVGRLDPLSPTFTEDLAELEGKAEETCATLNVAERRV